MIHRDPRYSWPKPRRRDTLVTSDEAIAQYEVANDGRLTSD
jgi:hypothetical protein